MKKIYVLSIIMSLIFMIGCEKAKGSSDVNIHSNEIEELYENIMNDLDIINEYAKSLYENNPIDSDSFRNCQKNMREYQDLINKIELDTIKEDYQSNDKYEEYRDLVKKYNQMNRSVKYFKGGMSDILADNIVDEDEVFDFICMYNICKYDNALQGDIRDYEGYEEITKEYGFSLIDKQEEFDNEYGVEDIR